MCPHYSLPAQVKNGQTIWWGYLHVDGSIMVKRLILTMAFYDCDFCHALKEKKAGHKSYIKRAHRPFFATSVQHARAILTHNLRSEPKPDEPAQKPNRFRDIVDSD